MWSDIVIPREEFLDGVEGVSVCFVGVEPSFDFPIGLWVFNPCKNLFDAVNIKPVFELAFSFLVVGKLVAVVTDAFSDRSVL